MIVIRDIPGLTTLETLQELIDISPSDVVTGHGGFVVSEKVAYTFLRAYLTMLGEIQPAQPVVPVVPEPVEPEPIEPPEPVWTPAPGRRGRKSL